MKKVLVIFGGPSDEHLISCKSTRGILENIDKKKYDVNAVGISLENKWYEFNDSFDLLESGNWIDSDKNKYIENIVTYLKKFDVVFPMIHGEFGEDGKLSSLFDLFNIKYVGSNNLAHAISYDKVFTKMICNYFNIKQIDYVVIRLDDKKYIQRIEEKLGYPVIVKPACSGSSIGISVANNKKELKMAVKEAFKYGNKVIVEKYIKIDEKFECSILFDKKIIASSVGEIVLNDNIYDYDSKYVKKAQVMIPAFINKELDTLIKELSIKIFNYLECFGLARIDFIYDNDKDILYFNEINTIPGFTDISMYAKAFIYDGISYSDLISKLIDSALKKE